MTANILVDIPKPVSTSLGAAQPAVDASPGELWAFQAADGMTVADCLLAYLDCEDVDAVFGIPGGNIASIVQGLRAHPRIRYIIASHEGGAAFMADGYARATGKLGVCLVTAGPGLLNALSGVASAHLDQVPLLLVSGQVSTDRFGLGAIQESTSEGGINTVELVRHATGSSTAIVDPSSFPRLLSRALRVAQAGAAAHLCIAANVARQKVPHAMIPTTSGAFRSARPPATADDVRRLFTLLERAHRPLIFLGSGAREVLADRHEDFRALVHALGAPVATSMRGKGLFDETDPLALGVLGIAGSQRAERYLREGVDALVVLGSRLSEWATRSFSPAFSAAATVAQVDLSPTVFGRLVPVHLPILGDVGSVIRGLCVEAGRPGAVDTRRASSRYEAGKAAVASIDDLEGSSADGPLKPQQLCIKLGAALRGNMDLYIDMGNCTAWATSHLRIQPPTRIFYPCGISTMGWSCGAVVGGKLGRPERVAVALTGDGSFLMNGNEVRTAARYGIGTVTVVLNDDYLGMVNHGEHVQQPHYGLNDRYFSLGGPDLESFATSLGAQAYQVDQPDQFAQAFAEAVTRADVDRRPQVIVAHIDPYETPPYGERFAAIASHGGKT